MQFLFPPPVMDFKIPASKSRYTSQIGARHGKAAPRLLVLRRGVLHLLLDAMSQLGQRVGRADNVERKGALIRSVDCPLQLHGKLNQLCAFVGEPASEYVAGVVTDL